MSSGLDKSLDDIIKSNKRSGSGNFSGRGRGSGAGPVRHAPNRSGVRAAPYTAPKAPDAPWRHDMFMDQPMSQPGRVPSIETGTKLYISNLDYGVSNEDVKELFSEVGDLKRYSIHYDRSGRSKGTAEVVFSRQSDAVAAVKRYNGVQLDGKPMKIEIVGSNIGTSVAPAAANSNFGYANGVPRGYGNGVPRGGHVRVGIQGRLRGGGSGGGRGRGRGRGQGRGRGEKVSAEDLDADLEKYHSQAMED